MKKKYLRRTFAVITLFLLILAPLSGMKQETSQISASLENVGESVLERIETFEAPPYPTSGYGNKETYDYRIMNNAMVPPSLEETLIFDLWLRLHMDLHLIEMSTDLIQKPPSIDDVRRAINIYIEREWKDIAGLRPWTHSNFIRGLDNQERKKLAEEVQHHMAKYGVQKLD